MSRTSCLDSILAVTLGATVISLLTISGSLSGQETHEKAKAAHVGKAAAAKTLVRVDLAEFVKDEKKLAALRKAVKKMRELDSKDPRSWIFQANIHWRPFFPDYVYGQAKVSADPAQQLFRDDTGFSPDPPVFNQCPHGNWWFLPWHRAYLHYFERILRWAAEDQTLTLPYWTYHDPNQRELPSVFRAARIDKKTDNPLYLPESATFMDKTTLQVFLMRDGPLLRGETQLTPSVASLDALNVVPFFSLKPLPASNGFGSPAACDPTCGCGSGALERIPHNRIHTAIGGSSAQAGGAVRIGFMGDVATAARDPIFWLHHANIDRLWSSWAALEGRKNPDDPEWLDYPFTFFDVSPDGKPVPVTITPRELLTTEQLGYAYDRLETPPKAILAAIPAFQAGEMRSVAATAPPTRPAHGIIGDPGAIRVSATAPTVVFVPLSTAIKPEPLRTLLKEPAGALVVSLEGIDFKQLPGVDYEVYLNLRKGERAMPSHPSYVGTLTFFGSRHPAGKAPHSAHHVPLYDRFVTPRKLRQLLADSKDAGAGLTITFVPDRGTMPIESKTAIAPAEHPGIVIRQVRILLAR